MQNELRHYMIRNFTTGTRFVMSPGPNFRLRSNGPSKRMRDKQWYIAALYI